VTHQFPNRWVWHLSSNSTLYASNIAVSEKVLIATVG